MCRPEGVHFKKNNPAGIRVLLKTTSALLVILLFTVLTVWGQTTGDYRSRQNGNWETVSTWQRFNGTSWVAASFIPGSGNNVTVNHEVVINSGTTAEVNNLILNSNANFTIDGTLKVLGNLTMVNNDPELSTGSEARVFILGNAIIANKVNINLSSYFIVAGNFTINGGGATDIDINNASFYVFGTFSPGTTGLTSCNDYDNLTVNESELCHVGTETAFEENVDNGLIPTDIQEIIYPCTAPVITNPGAQAACDSYSLPTIAGTNLSGNQKYYNNSQALGGTVITGSITSTQTVWIYDANGSCSDEESFVVTINTTPVIANPGVQTACDSYTLTTITGTNLSGNEAYYDDSQANSGTEITGPITSTQTVWIYDTNGTCSDEESFLVTINPLPTAIIIENNSPLCAGDDAIFTLTGTTGAVVTYRVNSGSDQTITLTGGTATITISNAPENQTLTLVSVTNGTCSQSLGTSSSITVNPLPEIGNFLNN